MQFEFTVKVEVERVEGKFAGRDELEEQIQEAIDGADPGSIEGESGGSYDVLTWDVSPIHNVKSGKKSAAVVVRPPALRA